MEKASKGTQVQQTRRNRQRRRVLLCGLGWGKRLGSQLLSWEGYRAGAPLHSTSRTGMSLGRGNSSVGEMEWGGVMHVFHNISMCF
jgi:hypothetical protein